MRTRDQNWILVMITMGPMHWSIGRNPSPKQDMFIIKNLMDYNVRGLRPPK